MVARRALLISSVLPVVLLAGCGVTYGDQRLLTVEEVPPLTRSGGCGEAFLWAADEDGRTAVVVDADLRDRSTTDPTTLEVTLPDPAVEVVLVDGEDLTAGFCTDLPTSEVERETPVVAGEVVLRVDPPATGSGQFAEGSFEVVGAVAEDGRVVPDTQATTEYIGFRAG